MASHTNPFAESGCVFGLDVSGFNVAHKSESEHMFAVMLPYSHKVGFFGDLGCLLVWEYEVFLFENLRSQFAEGFVLTFEGGTTLGGGGVHTEDHLSVLVSMGKGPEKAITFLVIVFLVQHVATISPSGGLGDFVIEKS